MIEAIFGIPKAIIGVVHLLPLPGSSRWDGDLQAVIDRAVKDAKSLEMGGIHGVIVENYGDVPFRKSNVFPSTISAMTLTVKAVKESVNLPIGVNVLRNDALSALSIATVTNANFIRVNVHLGTMVTDEGIIEGQTEETLRYRGLLGSNVKIFAGNVFQEIEKKEISKSKFNLIFCDPPFKDPSIGKLIQLIFNNNVATLIVPFINDLN